MTDEFVMYLGATICRADLRRLKQLEALVQVVVHLTRVDVLNTKRRLLNGWRRDVLPPPGCVHAFTRIHRP